MNDSALDEDDEAPEPEEEVDSNEMFCRFTPWQLDKYASHLLGEEPLCEKWISRDGKQAILWGLRLTHKRKPGISGREFGERVNLAELWKTKLKK
jgi:hypothetical protein